MPRWREPKQCEPIVIRRLLALLMLSACGQGMAAAPAATHPSAVQVQIKDFMFESHGADDPRGRDGDLGQPGR